MLYERLLTISARHQKLLDLISSGEHSAPGLAELLGVSEQTVYRDITSLNERGHNIKALKIGQTWAYQSGGKPLPK